MINALYHSVALVTRNSSEATVPAPRVGQHHPDGGHGCDSLAKHRESHSPERRTRFEMCWKACWKTVRTLFRLFRLERFERENSCIDASTETGRREVHEPKFVCTPRDRSPLPAPTLSLIKTFITQTRHIFGRYCDPFLMTFLRGSPPSCAFR